MRRFGLIGRPLGHSASAAYFTDKFRSDGITDCEYSRYELPSIEALPALLERLPELCGLNVTIPYKREVMAFLDAVSPEAQAIGAVNCIRRAADGSLTGYNTDIVGLRAALDYLEREGEALRHREHKLAGHLWARLMELEEDGLRVLGTREVKRRTGVVSVDFLHADNGEMAFRLEQEYGIETRCGLHCAPMAHRTLGTFPQGAVRFSVGPFTRFEEIDYVHGAVYELLLETGG